MSDKALVSTNGNACLPRIDAPEARPMASPRTDVLETREAFVLVVDVPGVDEKGVELSLHDGLLTVHAAPPPGELDPNHGPAAFAGYHRDFHLAAEVRSDKVEATVRDGVLKIVLPKAETFRKIEVRNA
jgi:HSP20 family molecular chaperone IbpA